MPRSTFEVSEMWSYKALSKLYLKIIDFLNPISTWVALECKKFHPSPFGYWAQQNYPKMSSPKIFNVELLIDLMNRVAYFFSEAPHPHGIFPTHHRREWVLHETIWNMKAYITSNLKWIKLNYHFPTYSPSAQVFFYFLRHRMPLVGAIYLVTLFL